MRSHYRAHDLHACTLTSERDVATVHLMTTKDTDPYPVLDQARDFLQSEHNTSHVTLQVEPEDHHGCTELNW